MERLTDLPVDLPLIFITSNFSGTENTDYTNLLDYDRNITTAGAINLGHASDTTIARSAAGKVTIEGNEIYHEGHKPTLAELGAQASGSYITGSGSLSAQDLLLMKQLVILSLWLENRVQLMLKVL